MAEKSYYDKILESFGVGATPKFTNQELGLGSIGNSGANINSDVFLSGSNGPALNMSEPANYLRPTNTNFNVNTTGETGLGSIFGSDAMKTLGGYAQTGQAVLGLYTGLDNLFGSGASDRKDSKNMMKKAFEQNYAMNDMAIKKFKEDNAHFKKQRSDITASYNA